MKIIYNDPSDGTLTEVTPLFTDINPATGKIWTIEEIAEKDVPVGVSTYSIVEDSVIPTDFSFRGAWVGVGVGTTGATITEDITKAKEVHKANIRLARTPKFAELDIQFQLALEHLLIHLQLSLRNKHLEMHLLPLVLLLLRIQWS